MIRLATPADLSQAADIYEEILDREAQGPVYTNWQRGKYPTIDTARQGRTVIRLDTWEGNLPANRLYPSLGYRYAGTAEFFFMGFVRENLNCYEKAL